MPAGGRFVAEWLRTYRGYTGESVQHASRWLEIDRSSPILGVGGDQARLESLVFTAMADARLWTTYPFAIVRVRPAENGALIVHLDRYAIGFDGLNDVAEEVFLYIAPHADADGSLITGIPGLRVRRMRGRDLFLSLQGTDSTIILRCARGTTWKRALDSVHGRVEGASYRPLWNDPTVSAGEGDHIAWKTRAFGHLEWLGSGLLRRAGLFHSTTNAFFRKGWACDKMFKFELTSSASSGSYHEKFIKRLSDPIWGVPLIARKHECYCDRHPSPTRMCWIELKQPGSTETVLQLRFDHEPLQHSSEYRAKFQAIGADPLWLDRILPHRFPAREASDSGSVASRHRRSGTGTRVL